MALGRRAGAGRESGDRNPAGKVEGFVELDTPEEMERQIFAGPKIKVEKGGRRRVGCVERGEPPHLRNSSYGRAEEGGGGQRPDLAWKSVAVGAR